MRVTTFLIWAGALCSVILYFPFACKSGSWDHVSLQWTQSTPFPKPTSDYAAGAVDGKLVIAGGTYWEGSKGDWIKKHFSATTYAFDPVTQVWEKLPNLPTPLAGAASAVIRNKLFVLGGYTGTSVNRKIYILDKESGKFIWKYFSTLPVSRVFAEAASVGNRLFLLGGTTQFEPLDQAGTCCTSKTATNSFMVLDITHPERGWNQLAPLPGPLRWLFSTVSEGHSIWMFGGRFQKNRHNPITNYNLVFRYNIANSNWEAMKPLPEESPDAIPPSPVLVKGKIILVFDNRKVWLLEPLNALYSDLSPLPEAAAVDRFVWLKNRIVGAGGENNIEGPRRRSDWTFIGQFFATGKVSSQQLICFQ